MTKQFVPKPPPATPFTPIALHMPPVVTISSNTALSPLLNWRRIMWCRSTPSSSSSKSQQKSPRSALSTGGQKRLPTHFSDPEQANATSGESDGVNDVSQSESEVYEINSSAEKTDWRAVDDRRNVKGFSLVTVSPTESSSSSSDTMMKPPILTERYVRRLMENEEAARSQQQQQQHHQLNITCITAYSAPSLEVDSPNHHYTQRERRIDEELRVTSRHKALDSISHGNNSEALQSKPSSFASSHPNSYPHSPLDAMRLPAIMQMSFDPPPLTQSPRAFQRRSFPMVSPRKTQNAMHLVSPREKEKDFVAIAPAVRMRKSCSFGNEMLPSRISQPVDKTRSGRRRLEIMATGIDLRQTKESMIYNAGYTNTAQSACTWVQQQREYWHKQIDAMYDDDEKDI